MSTKETLEFLTESVQKWQKIELASVTMARKSKEKTDNPLLLIVLEILERDSEYHHRLQQVLLEALENGTLPLKPEDVGLLSDLIDMHHKVEKDVIEIGRSCRGALGDQGGFVLPKFILDYLINDEEKHDALLDGLAKVKSGMYPYGG
ncbi:MAG: hypothetical protein C4523_09715 [Myxococcales bacterium]|nr:MAG: hypothetical protein C4523_09715 [Myxococcales bacterium]